MSEICQLTFAKGFGPFFYPRIIMRLSKTQVDALASELQKIQTEKRDEKTKEISNKNAVWKKAEKFMKMQQRVKTIEKEKELIIKDMKKIFSFSDYRQEWNMKYDFIVKSIASTLNPLKVTAHHKLVEKIHLASIEAGTIDEIKKVLKI